jgi:hypothetical protein
MSIKNIYGILEHDLEMSWNIYGFALKAYNHTDFFFHQVPKEKRELISKSNSLKFLRVVCARTCVLEISKMLAPGASNHYSLWILENRIRNKKFVGTIKISKKTLDEILHLLNENKKEFERIKVVRDKIVAHDDYDNHIVPTNIYKYLLPSLNLIHSILCRLSKEQYNKECPPIPSKCIKLDIDKIIL